MREHTLKTSAACWDAIKAGEKTWEVRKNDRFFQPGDTVILRKLDETGRHYETGDGGRFSTCDLTFKIGWMLQGGQFGIEPGYCVFSLVPVRRK